MIITQLLGISLTDDQLSELKTLFSDDSLVNPFKGLETVNKQEKFIQENFNYVVCRIFVLIAL